MKPFIALHFPRIVGGQVRRIVARSDGPVVEATAVSCTTAVIGQWVQTHKHFERVDCVSVEACVKSLPKSRILYATIWLLLESGSFPSVIIR